ncbi:MAG: sigma 54-interacting transcriptional regulator [Flavobacteriales bacterium]|nr:sigma 54-interacting transcriptional regulator [Flavobacteriales bacterium]
MTIETKNIKTLGELKKAGYQSRSIKEEMRENLIKNLKENNELFEEIWGYEETVIPQLERAILAQHNILFLGLRGQAKTRMARLMTKLLDSKIPIIKGSEINDNPFQPISKFGRDSLEKLGDDLPISWISSAERYVEKLATPDVSVADLIGDIDPIKAANQKLSLSDPDVIHYGLIPRANRGIFVINELPDLQPRIQVSLFNILEEGDIQIRGFNLRLPLDVLFIFTANPEDYTNRGSIITPLKDRIECQILTHYPRSRDIGKQITAQEASIHNSTTEIEVDELIKDLVEQVAIEARSNEYVDEKSGVSTRLTISALETAYASAERRAILNNEKKGFVRISDVANMITAIVGKIEMVYEGEQEGVKNVSEKLISEAIRKLALEYYPALKPNKLEPNKSKDEFASIISWFEQGNRIQILNDADLKDYYKALDSVDNLKNKVQKVQNDQSKYLHMEFLLHALAEYSLLGKESISGNFGFVDLLGSMLNFQDN